MLTPSSKANSLAVASLCHELARGGLDLHRELDQQAGLQKSGSKLPQSKAHCYAGLAKLRRDNR